MNVTKALRLLVRDPHETQGSRRAELRTRWRLAALVFLHTASTVGPSRAQGFRLGLGLTFQALPCKSFRRANRLACGHEARDRPVRSVPDQQSFGVEVVPVGCLALEG